MAYSATVLRVMIASPGDVGKERQIIRDVLHGWNDVHSLSGSLVLLPVGWDTHAAPDLAGRPQGIINKRILENCDVLVGVFWTRLGSPTGEEDSGTVEEIKRHVAAGKPAMIYFSSTPVAPESIDATQYAAVQQFKRWCMDQGLVTNYDNEDAFRRSFGRDIQIIINESAYIAEVRKLEEDPDFVSVFEAALGTSNQPLNYVDTLTPYAKDILTVAAEKDGEILFLQSLSGAVLQAGDWSFIPDGTSARDEAKWQAALQQLVEERLIADRGYKGEVFGVTAKGFDVADDLKAAQGAGTEKGAT